MTLTLGGLQPTQYYSAWRPGATSQVTNIVSGHLQAFDPATGVTHEVANLGFTRDNTFSYACAATWTPNGRYLVFALCDTSIPAFAGLPPKIFVYDSQAQ